jgi:hypothetical protein
LRSDGLLEAFGDNLHGECNVPQLPPGRTYVEVAAGYGFSIARLSDGTLNAWGSFAGGSGPPPPPPGLVYVEIRADDYWGAARRSDGRIIGFGFGIGIPAPPPGASYLSFAAGSQGGVARDSNGTLTVWGSSGPAFDKHLPQGAAESILRWDGGGLVAAILRRSPDCGTAAKFCEASPNSFSADGAKLIVAGCPSLTANDLELQITGVPPGALGLLSYGSQPVQLPFGGGWSCIGGSEQVVVPYVIADANGTVTFSVDLTQFPFSGSSNPIVPGSGWCFQLRYRDTASSTSRVNFSDAQYLVFSD